MERNDATNSRSDEAAETSENSDNESVDKEELERNADLEEKLNEDDQWNLCNTMDVSSLNVTDDDIPLIIERTFCQDKKKYSYLVLRDNALTSIGIKILVDELIKRPVKCLRNLGLSCNLGIGDEGIEHLVRLLKQNRSITILVLHNTGITDRGVRLLADLLCDTTVNSICALEKLYISFNKFITDESLPALIQILEQNQTLKLLALQRCNLSDSARRRLRLICTKKRKRKFSLSE